MSAHLQQRLTSSVIKQRPIVINMGRKRVVPPLQKICSDAQRPPTEINMETLLALLPRLLTSLATRLRPIVTVTATQQENHSPTPIALVTPIPPIRIPMAILQVHQRLQQTSLATLQQPIATTMVKPKARLLQPLIALGIATHNSAATIQTLSFGLGKITKSRSLAPR